MNAILNEFQTDFNSNIDLIKNEYDKSISQLKDLEEKNNILEQENIKLTNIINELNKEKKAKASSTIWESMNSKLAEKDIIIEQLKKDIEFYKRTSSKSNIAEKWQSNISKSNSSDSIETKETKIPISNKSVEKEIKLTEEELEIKEKRNMKNGKVYIEKVSNEEDINDVEDINDEEEQEEEQVIKKSKKHKSKDKSKDKSEKKKKKKKKVVEEENE